jgi:hypothetical protein
MKTTTLVAAPLAVVLLFPLLVLFAVASVGGISQTAACIAPAAEGGGAMRIGTLNWRGASHYRSDPHPGERPYTARVANMVAKVNASAATIVGFQEFESPQARAFLAATNGRWALARGRVHGRPDTRDAIAYQPSAWTVIETRYVEIDYGGTPEQIPFVRFASTSGLGDIWVLNTHNPADVVHGSDQMRDAAVHAEADALRRQHAADPAAPLLFVGDMNDSSRFSRLFLTSAGPGWTAANPIHATGDTAGWGGHIDWIMGGPGVSFTSTVTDKTTNDGARNYTDHPFVYATVQAAPSAGRANGGANSVAVTDRADPLRDAEVAAAAAYQAGFRGTDLYTMVWIAGGESGYDPHALNRYSQAGRTYAVYGLWQISSIHAGVSPPSIYDPLTNARRAFALYRGRGGSRLGDGGPASRFDDWAAHTAANETAYGSTARKAITATLSGMTGTAVTGEATPAIESCAGSSALPAGMTGSGTFTPNTSVAYVGPYSPGQLVARMQRVIALNGTGRNVDPFFGTEPDGSWYLDCQHFVANLDGRSTSGYKSAAIAWAHFLSTGAAHPAGSADGMSPPAGAWLYYGDNHVVIYLGNNLVAGTDTWGTGTAKIGPAADVQRWLAGEGGYKGWVVPWGGPTASAVAA